MENHVQMSRHTLTLTHSLTYKHTACYAMLHRKLFALFSVQSIRFFFSFDNNLSLSLGMVHYPCTAKERVTKKDSIKTHLQASNNIP